MEETLLQQRKRIGRYRHLGEVLVAAVLFLIATGGAFADEVTKQNPVDDGKPCPCDAVLAPKAAKSGSANDFYILGECYREGKEWGASCKADVRKAFKAFKTAGDKGLAAAQDTLGWMTMMGTDSIDTKEMPINVGAACRWWAKAAAQGYAPGQFDYAGCFEAGYGVKKDKGKAIEWYEKAAAQKFKPAIDKLAELKGKGD